MKTYFDKTFGKRLYVCEDGCSTGRFAEIVKDQCINNTSKECLQLIHTEHCICNK